MSISESEDWSSVPAGTHVVLRTSEPMPLVVLNSVSYEVADGDLLVRSRSGNVLQLDAGEWAAIGTVEHPEGGGTFLAFETWAAAS